MLRQTDPKLQLDETPETVIEVEANDPVAPFHVEVTPPSGIATSLGLDAVIVCEGVPKVTVVFSATELPWQIAGAEGFMVIIGPVLRLILLEVTSVHPDVEVTISETR